MASGSNNSHSKARLPGNRHIVTSQAVATPIPAVPNATPTTSRKDVQT